MNILHYTGMPNSTKYGGLERWFVEFCKQSTEKGHTFHLIYTESFPSNYHYINDIKTHKGNIKICEGKKSLIEYIKAQNIDIIFCHFNEPYEICKDIKNTCNVKLYQFLHCHNYYSTLSWVKNFREKLCSLVYSKSVFLSQFFIDGFIAVSDGVIRQFLLSCGIMPYKIRRIYLGVINSTSHNYPPQHDHQRIIIGCVAFHAQFKGVDILIRAVEILKNRGVSDFEVWQIGGGLATAKGKDTEMLHQLVKRKCLEPWFKWYGVRQDIDALMDEFDIYVQPSRNEAISLTIAEAMTHGIPVVASNVGGIPEYIRNGVTGFLYNNNNPELLADKLQLLMAHQQLRIKLGNNGFKYINSEQFDIRKSVETVIRLYCKKQ